MTVDRLKLDVPITFTQDVIKACSDPEFHRSFSVNQEVGLQALKADSFDLEYLAIIVHRA